MLYTYVVNIYQQPFHKDKKDPPVYAQLANNKSIDERDFRYRYHPIHPPIVLEVKSRVCDLLERWSEEEKLNFSFGVLYYAKIVLTWVKSGDNSEDDDSEINVVEWLKGRKKCIWYMVANNMVKDRKKCMVKGVSPLRLST